MIGTLINGGAIIIGGLLGMLLGDRLPEKLRQTVVAGLGLFIFALGMQMFLKTQNMLIVLGAILIGIIIGELLNVEGAIHNLGGWLGKLVSSGGAENQSRFAKGFMTTTLMFCVGPMAILGSIQDGLTGNHSTLAVKAVLDGFAALAFAASLGGGVIFSSLPLVVYQGGISLLAAQVQSVATPLMMSELTATGGVIMLAIGLGSMLELKPIRVGNFLPALFVAPLIVLLLAVLGIHI